MARDVKVGEPAVSPAQGLTLLRDLVESGKKLCARGYVEWNAGQVWRAQAQQALADALGRDHRLMRKAVTAGFPVIAIGQSDQELANEYAKSITSQVCLMEGACIPHLERLASTSAAVQAPMPLARLRHLLARFHAVALKLRQRHGARAPLMLNDEYDVQDLLSGLLALDFSDVRSEEHTPSYAGQSTRMDFLLKQERVVVEAKFARSGHADREIGGELLEDIARYKTHPDCGRLVCFVYDPTNAIRNPTGLEQDLSGNREGLPVEVVIVPKP